MLPRAQFHLRILSYLELLWCKVYGCRKCFSREILLEKTRKFKRRNSKGLKYLQRNGTFNTHTLIARRDYVPKLTCELADQHKLFEYNSVLGISKNRNFQKEYIDF